MPAPLVAREERSGAFVSARVLSRLKTKAQHATHRLVEAVEVVNVDLDIDARSESCSRAPIRSTFQLLGRANVGVTISSTVIDDVAVSGMIDTSDRKSGTAFCQLHS